MDFPRVNNDHAHISPDGEFIPLTGGNCCCGDPSGGACCLHDGGCIDTDVIFCPPNIGQFLPGKLCANSDCTQANCRGACPTTITALISAGAFVVQNDVIAWHIENFPFLLTLQASGPGSTSSVWRAAIRLENEQLNLHPIWTEPRFLDFFVSAQCNFRFSGNWVGRVDQQFTGSLPTVRFFSDRITIESSKCTGPYVIRPGSFDPIRDVGLGFSII